MPSFFDLSFMVNHIGRHNLLFLQALLTEPVVTHQSLFSYSLPFNAVVESHKLLVSDISVIILLLLFGSILMAFAVSVFCQIRARWKCTRPFWFCWHVTPTPFNNIVPAPTLAFTGRSPAKQKEPSEDDSCVCTLSQSKYIRFLQGRGYTKSILLLLFTQFIVYPLA